MANYPYGSWPSPLSAKEMASGSKRMSGLAFGEGRLWWAESRPANKGRVTLLRSSVEADPTDVVGGQWSVRSSVHEYGGRSWWLGSRSVFFVNWDDQRIYQASTNSVSPEPTPVTPEPDGKCSWRHADGDQHRDSGWVVAVRETHMIGDAAAEPVNEIVAVSADSGGASASSGPGTPTVVAAGADFYSAPRFSPDGGFISWIEWDHPQMPWDGTRLMVAKVNIEDRDGLVVNEPTIVAGGDDISIMGADWTGDGQLVFSNDQTGFWNLERYLPDSGEVTAVTALAGAEIGAPAWIFGTQQWVELSNGDLGVVVTQAACDSLAVVPSTALSSKSGALTLDRLTFVESDFTRVDELVAGPGGDMYVSGLTAEGPAEIAHVVVGQERQTVYCPGTAPKDLGWVSTAQPVEFSSGDGVSHAFFYPPTGAVDGRPIEPNPGELPPLIVMGHGGPTAHSAPAYSLKVQYWTSRGFAVADVNYRGSTGFGRDYRRLLNGQWGIVDVEDCIAVAEYLAGQGLVDGTRMAIRGGSAGGFTVLRALQTSTVFGAGTSLYGVADLEALATDTHKFESRYLDGMIGPYPQCQDIYQQRSPINHTDGLNCPLLVLQGTEDKVVPPSQSEAIVAAVASKGLPHAYIAFEGEQHGFRQAETIVRSFEAELWFYGKVFGFTPADDLAAPAEATGF